MAITFKQLTESKGKRLRYTYENDGNVVYGSVQATTPKLVHVLWEDENTMTEYGINDTLVDLPHIDLIDEPVTKQPKTLTRSTIKKAIEDAVLLGVDTASGKHTHQQCVELKNRLIENLLG